MPSRELFVITDKPPPYPGMPDAILGLTVRTRDWQDVRQLGSASEDVLLIDLDLRDISKVKAVKDNLPSRHGSQCKIIVVDRASHLAEAQAYGLGATDLLKRPFAVHELIQILRRHLGLITAPEPSARDQSLERAPGGASIAAAASSLEGLFTALIGGSALQLKEIASAGNQVVDAVGDCGVKLWLDTVRSYHEGTFQHCLLVTGVATAFGQSHGMRRADVLTLTLAGLLHDVGKAQIPLQILDKPGRLTAEEFAVIQTHPAIGHRYLLTQKAISPDVLDVVRHHHEYLDGSGYPDGLAGGALKDLTRIMTLCDVYGAMVECRSYRAPQSPSVGIDILNGMAREGKVEASLVTALAHVVLEQ